MLQFLQQPRKKLKCIVKIKMDTQTILYTKFWRKKQQRKKYRRKYLKINVLTEFKYIDHYIKYILTNYPTKMQDENATFNACCL